MISNSDLIIYACIAKGPTILAEFISSKESGIEVIAQKCIEKTPPHHSGFSHTVRERTYTFLINDPFAYFLIFHESVEKSESIWVLNRVKIAFEEFIRSKHVQEIDNLGSNCFQGDFGPVFQVMLSLNAEESMPKETKNSIRGMISIMRSLLSEPGKFLTRRKKQDLGCGDGEGGNGKGIAVMNKEFSVPMHNKNGGEFYMGEGRQQAKQIWRELVWSVLILDLIICAGLFGIWLLICNGFECIEG